jgi:glycerol-3-phosphate cytidylyltransferase
MLRECKENCDWLIVGLQTDPTIDRPDTKNKPAQSVYERFVQLHGCKFVDEIVPYSTEKDLMDMLATIPMHVRFVGEEYRHVEFTGFQYCVENGIEIFYNQRRHGWSTTELRKRAKL